MHYSIHSILHFALSIHYLNHHDLVKALRHLNKAVEKEVPEVFLVNARLYPFLPC